jgi:hypothetical protein
MDYYIYRGGHDSEPSGPYSLADLRNMAAQGQIAPNDVALGGGLPSWVPVSQVLAGIAPPHNAAGANVGRVAAIMVLIAFFLPWISCPGVKPVSGVELANNGASGLWIIPISMLIALGVLISNRKSVQDRARDAKVVIGAGLASLAVLLYYYAKLNGAGEKDALGLDAAVSQLFTFEIGAILSLLGSIGTAIGGFLHLRSASQSHARAPVTGVAASTDEGKTDG